MEFALQNTKFADEWGVLSTICEALEKWNERICALETTYDKTNNLHGNVLRSLELQKTDGLITEHEAKELEHIADHWQKLHLSFSCKVLGCEFSSPDIINSMLELFTAKQISKEFFIEIVLKLFQNV